MEYRRLAGGVIDAIKIETMQPVNNSIAVADVAECTLLRCGSPNIEYFCRTRYMLIAVCKWMQYR